MVQQRLGVPVTALNYARLKPLLIAPGCHRVKTPEIDPTAAPASTRYTPLCGRIQKETARSCNARRDHRAFARSPTDIRPRSHSGSRTALLPIRPAAATGRNDSTG